MADSGPDTTGAEAVTVALCQLHPRIGEREHNRARILESVRAAAVKGARVVVLPELATSGYVFNSREEARGLAEPADGPTAQALQQVAAETGVTVVLGIPEVDPSGRLFNSALVVDATGVRAVYRKAHLWAREPEFFEPGDSPPAVLDMGWGRLAVLVCYDLEFPEWVRRTALAGADLICAPTNWPAEPRPAGERPIEVVGVMAGAAASRVFIAACDRVGEERGTGWVSGSVVAGPDGYPLVLADLSDNEQLLLATCPLTEARDKSLGELNHRFDDRRPELYA